jgi:hypothetical protein
VISEVPFFKNKFTSYCDMRLDFEIEWNAGKNLTQKVMKKKPKKGAKNTKPVTKTEQCESFFNFFTPPQVPEDDDIDQDTAEALQDSMEQDYDIGYVELLRRSLRSLLIFGAFSEVPHVIYDFSSS